MNFVFTLSITEFDFLYSICFKRNESRKSYIIENEFYLAIQIVYMNKPTKNENYFF